MDKQKVFKEITSELHIQPNNLYLSKGGTVTRKGLRDVYYSLEPNAPKNLLKHQVTKEILKKLHIEEQPYHFSKGSTVTKDALIDILDAIRYRKHPQQAA